jgi:hypothetical protein
MNQIKVQKNPNDFDLIALDFDFERRSGGIFCF